MVVVQLHKIIIISLKCNESHECLVCWDLWVLPVEPVQSVLCLSDSQLKLHVFGENWEILNCSCDKFSFLLGPTMFFSLDDFSIKILLPTVVKSKDNSCSSII